MAGLPGEGTLAFFIGRYERGGINRKNETDIQYYRTERVLSFELTLIINLIFIGCGDDSGGDGDDRGAENPPSGPTVNTIFGQCSFYFKYVIDGNQDGIIIN